MAYIDFIGIKKTYRAANSKNDVEALKDISFSVEKDEFVAIMGESGSGKTSLLNIISLLDKPTDGKIILDGTDLFSIQEDKMARFRREYIGYVFQDFNLLDNFDIRDNIILPLILSNFREDEIKPRLEDLVRDLDLAALVDKYPYQISGGQKQRVAVARALITRPKIILADEPTGALDSQNSEDLLKLFGKINQAGQTILMVTHSIRAASYASRVLFIKDGRIFHQLYRGNRTKGQMYEEISKSLNFLAKGEGHV